ncbi:hypothetical protein HanHA300_Chr17g0669151 [Helianthus annuus]|nr:hypothetical protein HanHA300_Chr17g0669151 [Helianthus annuus]KAJ0637551.1 hypothetical protein HanOQP8_Chr17g0675211 [Helianthus annuus]
MSSGSETEPDPYSTPKLPLFSIPPPHHTSSPPGTSTPPLQTTTASVPFRWEEQPGKPRPCTDLIVAPTHHTKCLHLPPRLAATVDPTKISSPSPTTVLDGPDNIHGKSFFSSSSFRFVKERRRRERRQRSFDSDGGWSDGDGDGDGGGQKRLLLGEKVDGNGGGLFGSFRFKGNRKVTSSKMRRNSSVSKVTGSHFWAKIYEGFKQVVPWKKKSKIECFTL